jgi:hypothetical protein
MQGYVSFHPVDLKFFDRIVEPLVAGEKVNPENYLDTSNRVRTAARESLRYKLALEMQFELLQPPPPPAEGTMWQKVRARLERFDFKPDPLAVAVGQNVEPDLHLHGRPFLITEGSADRVATLVDEYLRADGEPAVKALILEQLVRLDKSLGGKIEPADPGHFKAEMVHRRELLASLKVLFDLPEAARQDAAWGRLGSDRRPAAEVLPEELPWLAVYLHSRAVPFWIGRDVDGLETVCRSAGVEPPGSLAPAWRLFSRSSEEFPQLRDALGFELKKRRDVGAFVTPEEVPELLSFLNTEGSRIIQIATQHGEGTTCATLLRKIRECARYAEQHGMGFLEASGIRPVELDADEDSAL